MPDWIPTARRSRPRRARARKRVIDYPLVNDELALLWMVNMGCIDMHAWYSRADKPDRPDCVLFDLDPSPRRRLRGGRRGRPARARGARRCSGSSRFPKTSGARRDPRARPDRRAATTYAETREFAEIVAGALARAHPGLVTTEWTKAKRRGVLVDANQNGAGEDDRVGLLGPAAGRSRPCRPRCAGTR